MGYKGGAGGLQRLKQCFSSGLRVVNIYANGATTALQHRCSSWIHTNKPYKFTHEARSNSWAKYQKWYAMAVWSNSRHLVGALPSSCWVFLFEQNSVIYDDWTITSSELQGTSSRAFLQASVFSCIDYNNVHTLFLLAKLYCVVVGQAEFFSSRQLC